MLGTRHEEYAVLNNSLPFVIHTDITRTPFNYSSEKNWHDDIEIQLCTKGSGSVLLNGEQYSFNEKDIIVVESNVIHYTFSEESLTYSCLIISSLFCENMGIKLNELQFLPLLNDDALVSKINELIKIYNDDSDKLRIAKLNNILLEIMIRIIEKYSSRKESPALKKADFEKVKNAIKYIRKNYTEKISLDELARYVYTDKYSLCRNFKRYSGKTVTQYANHYRCQRAADLISQGITVAEAARNCGFENLSFFTKTFKKYMGKLPSQYTLS